MSRRRRWVTRWEAARLAFVALLLALLGAGWYVMTARREPRFSIAGIRVTVTADTRSELFDRLSEFAQTYGFRIRIAPVSAGGEHFVVQMWRKDVDVVGDNPFDPQKYNIDFYRA